MALNLFEHIFAPSVAAVEMIRLVRNGGYLVTATPFAWRYHAYPLDALRYTHTAMRFFFESTGDVRTLHASYTKMGDSVSGHYADKSDEPLEGPFRDSTNMLWIGRRLDGEAFDANSLDHNAAFGEQVEGLPEPQPVARCWEAGEAALAGAGEEGAEPCGS